jgi:hypothetical protein
MKFGLGIGIEIGVTETLSVLDQLDWSFRTTDLNMDSIPDGFSFKVQSVSVKEFPDFPISSIPNQAAHGVNSTINTIVGRADAQQSLTYFAQKFTEVSCCLRIGFMYHELQYALSVSNIR